MRPLLARFICAVAELRDYNVDDIAARAGLSYKHMSQLRSGKRINIEEAVSVLRVLDIEPNTTIRRLENVKAVEPGQLDQLLTMLVLAFPRAESASVDQAVAIRCDKLALILPQTAAARASTLIARAFSRGDQRRSLNYRSACLYRNVFLGVGPRWKPWFGTGLKIEFNPSKLTAVGWRVVRAFVAACGRSEDVIVSRVDAAIDYRVPISQFQPLGTRARKVTVVGTVDGVETIYLGSKHAKLSLAIYDKHKELTETGEAPDPRPLTRVEARFKKRHWRVGDIVTLPNPFADLRLLRVHGEGLGLADRVLTQLAAVVGWPLLRRELSFDEFSRLVAHHEILASQTWSHPSELFAIEWPDVAGDLLAKLGLRSDVSVAADRDLQRWRWRTQMQLAPS